MATAARAPADLQACLNTEVDWRESGNPERPWRAAVGRMQWELQVNDFPDEPLYTLLVGNTAIGDFDDWPPLWTR